MCPLCTTGTRRDAPTGLTCALFPLTLHTGQTAAVGAGVSAGPLGTAPDPGGGRVVTCHRWRLYTYLGDPSPDPAQRA
jgi:hypothetical protein